ncbi:MAG: MFS transporter [Clostridiales bacterium 43-6]|nr:MAG: MFS transporter [Clostridiales bacterium 43-6]
MAAARLATIRISMQDDRDFTLFIIVGFLIGISSGIVNSVFNNFLNDIYHLSASDRGIVEIPRELPGLLIVFVLAALSFLGDVKIARIAMLSACLGLVGLGFLSPTFSLMIVFMMVFSLGQHLFMPISPSIGMNLSKPEEYGMRLAKLNAYNLIATLIGFALVWIGFSFLQFDYRTAFALAAVFYLFAAVVLSLMKKSEPHHKKFKMVFRKQYTLYYILCIVNGARKQIFLTFAPWVLIQCFHLSPPNFAVLGVVIAVISIVTRTVVGKAIDVKGERFILSLEAVLLFVLCLGYAFAGDLFSSSVALVITAICYILDNSMSTVEMARSTYLKKIVIDPADTTHTLAMGTSLDHIVSMSIPVFGGMLWVAAGYKYVFLFAAVIALLNFILSLKIRVKKVH